MGVFHLKGEAHHKRDCQIQFLLAWPWAEEVPFDEMGGTSHSKTSWGFAVFKEKRKEGEKNMRTSIYFPVQNKCTPHIEESTNFKFNFNYISQ